MRGSKSIEQMYVDFRDALHMIERIGGLSFPDLNRNSAWSVALAMPAWKKAR